MPDNRTPGRLTTGGVMERLGVAREVVIELCAKGLLTCTRDHRGWRLFDEAEVTRVNQADVRRIADEVFAAQQRMEERRRAEAAAWRAEAWVPPACELTRPGDFPVNPKDLATCRFCGASGVAWTLSFRTGRSYLVQARQENGVWIANRREFHSRVCTGPHAVGSPKQAPSREDNAGRLTDDEVARLQRIEKQLRELH